MKSRFIVEDNFKTFISDKTMADKFEQYLIDNDAVFVSLNDLKFNTKVVLSITQAYYNFSDCPIIPYGSINFIKRLRAIMHNLDFDTICNIEQFDFINYMNEAYNINYNKNFLNNDFAACKIKTLIDNPNYFHDLFNENKLFIKSNDSDKFVPGSIVNRINCAINSINREKMINMGSFISNIEYNNRSNDANDTNDRIMIAATYKNINDNEYRFYIINGELVSPILGDDDKENQYLNKMEKFIHNMINDFFSLYPTVVVDVVRTFDSGYIDEFKIIELNAIPCSGYYGNNDPIKVFSLYKNYIESIYNNA